MASMYEARWNNAKRLGHAIQKQIVPGKEVRFDGEPIESVEINDKEVLLRYDSKCCVLLFDNDVEHDDGMHTTVAAFNERMRERIKVYSALPLIT